MEIHPSDVLVIGGGPAGSIAAWWLARRGWHVCLVDKARFPRDKTCGDGLTPRAVAALQRLGLEELVRPHAFVVEGARLWAGAHVDVVWPFDPYVRPLPGYGYVVRRRTLDALLIGAARDAGVEVLEGAHARQLVREGARVVGAVAVRGDKTILCRGRFILIATGAGVGLLLRSGFLDRPPHVIRAARGYWHGVSAVAPVLEFFFLPEARGGYVWVFPVDDGVVNVGIGLYGNRTAGAPLPRLLTEVVTSHPAFAERFAQARLEGTIAAYPIRADFPRFPVWGWGWAAIGEAAGLVNPVTGEGIDLAIESAWMAAWSVDWALRSGDERPYALWPYGWQLMRLVAPSLRGLRYLRPWVMRPRALRIIIRQATRHPGLARRVMSIVLGTESPRKAFAPSTWWWLLR